MVVILTPSTRGPIGTSHDVSISWDHWWTVGSYMNHMDHPQKNKKHLKFNGWFTWTWPPGNSRDPELELKTVIFNVKLWGCSWWFFSNTSEKICERQIGSWNPKVWGENKKMRCETTNQKTRAKVRYCQLWVNSQHLPKNQLLRKLTYPLKTDAWHTCFLLKWSLLNRTCECWIWYVNSEFSSASNTVVFLECVNDHFTYPAHLTSLTWRPFGVSISKFFREKNTQGITLIGDFLIMDWNCMISKYQMREYTANHCSVGLFSPGKHVL